MWRAMFQGFCLMGKGGKLLIFVLHTRRLTRPQDLNHCLVKRLEHKLWNLMVQVVLTLWLIMWIWAQVLLSYTDSLKKICDMVFLTFFIGGIVPNTQCAVINTGNLVPIPKRLMGEPLCKRRVFWPLEQNDISVIKMRRTGDSKFSTSLEFLMSALYSTGILFPMGIALWS